MSSEVKFNSSFPHLIMSPLDTPSLTLTNKVVLKSAEKASVTLMLFNTIEACNCGFVKFTIGIEVGVYCSTITPFLSQSTNGKFMAIQVKFSILPEQREGVGLTPNVALEVSDSDLSFWASTCTNITNSSTFIETEYIIIAVK